MCRVKKKKSKTIFLLFTPQSLKIKNQKEIEEQKSKSFKDAIIANAQLSNKNWPISRINQVLNADDYIINANSDTSFEAGLEAGSRTCSKADFDFNNTDKANLVSRVLAIKANKS